MTALKVITTGKNLEVHNRPTCRKASRNQKMRDMKANLTATLILGEGLEMGYFANVSDENAVSIIWVILKMQARQYGPTKRYKHILLYMVSKPTVNNKIIVKIKKTVLIKYKVKGIAVHAQLEGPQNIPNFLNSRLMDIRGGGQQRNWDNFIR